MTSQELKDLIDTVAEDHDFLVFCQPVALYSCLGFRQTKKPSFLQRTISYGHRDVARKKESVVAKDRFQVRLSGFNCEPVKTDTPKGAPLVYVSVFAAVVENASLENEFRPKLVKVLHLKRDIDAATRWHSLALPSGRSRNSHLLLIVWDAHSDLAIESNAVDDAKQLCSGWNRNTLFGYIPDRSNIWWASLQLDGQEHVSSTVILQQAALSQHWQDGADEASILVHDASHTGCSRAWNEAVLSVDVSWSGNEDFVIEDGHTMQSRKRRERDWSEAYRKQRRARILPNKDAEVVFRYHLRDVDKCFDEAVTNLVCPFCRLRCNSPEGLRLHTHASHTAFDFELETPSDPAAATKLPTIMHVYVRNGIYDENGYYHDPETESFKDLYNSEGFAHHISQYPRLVAQLLSRAPDHNPPRSHKHDNGAMASRNEDGSNEASHGSSARMEQKKKSKSKARVAGAERPEVLERQYYHSKTAMPMTVEEVEAGLDSDDEVDFDLWQKRQRMDLHQRAEITPEERKLMLMWNTFAYHHPIHADYFIPDTCQRFAARHAADLRPEHMRRAFVTHMLLLWDHALLDAATMEKCLRIVDGKVPALPPQPRRPPPAPVPAGSGAAGGRPASASAGPSSSPPPPATGPASAAPAMPPPAAATPGTGMAAPPTHATSSSMPQGSAQAPSPAPPPQHSTPQQTQPPRVAQPTGPSSLQHPSSEQPGPSGPSHARPPSLDRPPTNPVKKAPAGVLTARLPTVPPPAPGLNLPPAAANPALGPRPPATAPASIQPASAAPPANAMARAKPS